MTGLVLTWLCGTAFMVVMMSVAFRAQLATGQGGWADAFWSFGLGIAGAGGALAPLSGDITARQWLVAALVLAWCTRLGTHIARRAASDAPDARYDRLKQEWGSHYKSRMFGFLMLQAGAASFLLVSLLLAAHNPAAGPFGGLGAQDLVATVLLLAAIAGETTADRQLAAFKKDPANKGKVCDIGLWAWSRHPNYFFEWLCWCAWPLFAIDLHAPLEWPWGWLSLTAPAYIYWLLTRVSGIPLLEQHMMRTRPEAFAAYAANTSAFFPRPPRR